MSIWQRTLSANDLNELNQSTLGEFFEINFTEIGEDFIKATMPVNSRTRQPFGLLHGGASVALAETIGSVASWAVINKDLFMAVGTEINASHVKAVTEGFVTAYCKPIKIGGKIHLWDIKIFNERDELCCVCRFTAMVIPHKNIIKK